MRVAPTAVIGGQIAPRGPGAHNPEHGIDKLAVVFGHAPPNCLGAPVSEALAVPTPGQIYHVDDEPVSLEAP